MDIKGLFTGWKFDVKTAIFTLVISPVILFLIAILKRHLKLWGSYALEGAMYWISRGFKRSLAGSLTLKRYCRLCLAGESRYLFVPSSMEIKLDVDKVFVTLTLESQGTATKTFSHRDVLEAGNRLRIIGDPGSGKSSLVKRLFRDACHQVLESPRKARFPILVELKNLMIPSTVPEKRLGDWFLEKLRSDSEKSQVYQMADCFNTYAESSGLLLLLDGLDEVSSSAYPRIHKAILALSERLGQLSDQTAILLTMRTQFHQQVKDAYRSSFGHAMFLKPFAPTDIYKFLTRWPFSTDADKNVARIYGELTDRPTLREMCSNPLVLAMYVAEDQTAGHVVAPDSRTEFYKKVTEELILKRRLQQTGPVPAHNKLREQRENILGRLAYAHLMDPTQSANSLAWVDALKVVQDVLKCTKAEAEIKFRELAKETGIISEERPEQTFRFIHLTFCEFLAAHESIEGQSAGWSKLVDSHRGFQKNHARPEVRSRLVEVIPFAAGLLPRVKRPAAISEVSKLGDNGLLARCFLETKLYDSEAWSEFMETQKNMFLRTPEAQWDETWLRDLHLFNVVARDASQCSAYIPAVGKNLDLDEFFRTLVGKQKDSLTKVLSAYARQDAAAAFRLAEVSNLDLVRDFPQVVMQHCDQPPFLALLLERISRESDRMVLLACLLTEAGLRSVAVGRLLFEQTASSNLRSYVLKVNANRRWYKPPFLPERLYTQLLTIALSNPNTSLAEFPLLRVLAKMRPPGARSALLHTALPLSPACVMFGMWDLMNTDALKLFSSFWRRVSLFGIMICGYTIMFYTMRLVRADLRSYKVLLGTEKGYSSLQNENDVTASSHLLMRFFFDVRSKRTQRILTEMDSIRKQQLRS